MALNNNKFSFSYSSQWAEHEQDEVNLRSKEKVMVEILPPLLDYSPHGPE